MDGFSIYTFPWNIEKIMIFLAKAIISGKIDWANLSNFSLHVKMWLTVFEWVIEFTGVADAASYYIK